MRGHKNDGGQQNRDGTGMGCRCACIWMCACMHVHPNHRTWRSAAEPPPWLRWSGGTPAPGATNPASPHSCQQGWTPPAAARSSHNTGRTAPVHNQKNAHKRELMEMRTTIEYIVSPIPHASSDVTGLTSTVRCSASASSTSPLVVVMCCRTIVVRAGSRPLEMICSVSDSCHDTRNTPGHPTQKRNTSVHPHSYVHAHHCSLTLSRNCWCSCEILCSAMPNELDACAVPGGAQGSFVLMNHGAACQPLGERRSGTYPLPYRRLTPAASVTPPVPYSMPGQLLTAPASHSSHYQHRVRIGRPHGTADTRSAPSQAFQTQLNNSSTHAKEGSR